MAFVPWAVEPGQAPLWRALQEGQSGEKAPERGKINARSTLGTIWGNRRQREKGTCLRSHSEPQTAGTDPKSPAEPGVRLAHQAPSSERSWHVGITTTTTVTIIKCSLRARHRPKALTCLTCLSQQPCEVGTARRPISQTRTWATGFSDCTGFKVTSAHSKAYT